MSNTFTLVMGVISRHKTLSAFGVKIPEMDEIKAALSFTKLPTKTDSFNDGRPLSGQRYLL